MNFDVGAARAARAEQERKPKSFTIPGHKPFALPVEFPMRVAIFWAERRIDEALSVLLGEEEHKRFDTVAKDELTVEDMRAIIEAISEMYGFASSGESPASVSSSSNGSRRPRRTSRASTG